MTTPPSTIVFRQSVRASDSAAIRALAESTGFFRPDEVDVAVELIDERLRDSDKSTYRFLFAELDGVVVGYSCFGEIPCTIGSYDLYWIVVDPTRQGAGIGRRLMLESESVIAGLGGRRIYVETSSTPRYRPTRTFYDRCQYVIAAELPDFYSPGDGKVIFVKADLHTARD